MIPVRAKYNRLVEAVDDVFNLIDDMREGRALSDRIEDTCRALRKALTNIYFDAPKIPPDGWAGGGSDPTFRGRRDNLRKGILK